MESMDDLNTPAQSGAEIAERKRVIEMKVMMRPEGTRSIYATAKQVETLINMGMPWREAFESTSLSATSFIQKYLSQSERLKRRYDAMKSQGNKTYCTCEFCLGHEEKTHKEESPQNPKTSL